MKPQLVMSDFQGEHNKDLEATSARLIRGGSWKKQRVVVVIPSADLIPAKVALSHWSLIFPPNNGVIRILALGQEVGEAYTNAIESVLSHPDLKDWEYLLCIEHDNAPPQDGLIKLLEVMETHPEFSCVGGLYHTKFEGGVPQIWGDIKDPIVNYRPQPPDVNGGLVECYGTGQGFTLYRLSMFKDKRLRKPWFKTLNGKDGQGLGTQDLYFAGDARAYGYRFCVACNVKVGHYDYKNDMMW